jgi:hypothetical protein
MFRLSRLKEESQKEEKTKMAQKQEVQKKMKSLDVQVRFSSHRCSNM